MERLSSGGQVVLFATGLHTAAAGIMQVVCIHHVRCVFTDALCVPVFICMCTDRDLQCSMMVAPLLCMRAMLPFHDWAGRWSSSRALMVYAPRVDRWRQQVADKSFTLQAFTDTKYSTMLYTMCFCVVLCILPY